MIRSRASSQRQHRLGSRLTRAAKGWIAGLILCHLARIAFAGLAGAAGIESVGEPDSGRSPGRHWASLPPVLHPLPTVNDTRWPLNWVDSFILRRLESEGLGPSAEANAVTLLRRLSFDLTGLPPTPEEVDEFVRDPHPGAYEKWVDRLLDRPAYGERMAAYWLDLVRFADTVGYHGDQNHAISPYRDWVIDALNENLPFDQFTREQLAGDLLPDAGLDALIASGYNRLLQTSHEGGVQEKEYLAIYAADRVRNVSAVWMGATLGCAQCHDHKYDPYAARDFYAMAAFFADIDEAAHLKKAPDESPTSRQPELRVSTRVERARIAELEERAIELRAALDTASSDSARTLECQLQDTLTEIDSTRNQARLTMITRSMTPRVTRILPRGNWLDDSGPEVEPAVPASLGRLPELGRRATRLDLANWLVDPQMGAGLFTARVMVNRYWSLLFGDGLAKVMDDFGGQGERPTHPELLDNLAIAFVHSGWDTKRLLKLLVLSRAYRQSSVPSDVLLDRDLDNRLWARQSRWRLPAEMIRDNALSVSGLLVHQLGGPSVHPYQPDGYYRHLNFPPRTYAHDTDAGQWRRGVYVHWQRQYLHPMLKAFDAPSREECIVQRPRSNTPLAALNLLNDPTFLEAARGLAGRALREGGPSVSSRLAHASRLVLSRAPDEFERETLTRLLGENQARYSEHPNEAAAFLGIGEAPIALDGAAEELAAWTMVARALLNLSESITRN